MKSLIHAIVLAGAIMIAAPAMASDTAGAAIEAAAGALQPNSYVWDDRTAAGQDGPVTVLVSIADQRAYVYRGATLVAASAVSTGKTGKDTPTGTYAILQKEVAHKSTLYDDASMPFMQRLTWDGIAIHAGRNPGFPNSHGCIRVPPAFARKLYAATRLGTTVTVTDEPGSDAAPADLVPADVPAAARAEAFAAAADSYRP